MSLLENQLPLLTAAEQRQLLQMWNNTDCQYQSTTIVELFEKQVALCGEACALVCEDMHMSYRQLNCQANQLAAYLRHLGVGPEIRVGVYLERSFEMIVALLAILKAGGAYVPLEMEYPRARKTYLIGDAGLTLILTQQQHAIELAECGAQLVKLDEQSDEIKQYSVENKQSSINADNLAYVIYTSGSSGKPKGVMVSHGGTANYLNWMRQTYPLDRSDRVLQTVPLGFDVSVREIFWPLISGATLVLAKPAGQRDISYIIESILRYQITNVRFVPAMLEIFLTHQQVRECGCLKRVFCGGEVMPPELVKRFYTILQAQLHNTYGPTETTVNATVWACQPEIKQSIPIGRPIANTRIYILDPYLQPLPIGVMGELYIAGVGLARGYLNRVDQTAEKFIPDPFGAEAGARMYASGDLARYLPDGEIEFLGRIDQQVKIRGFRIELAEIEAVLSEHKDIRQAIVIVREDRVGEKRLVAYIIARAEIDLSIT
ncbi:MAG: amino acid adenylation domain-containing protein, partial [Acidobacteriota bacterium]